MIKVLILSMSFLLVASGNGWASTAALDMPVKPRKEKAGLQFKVRSRKAKGPRAKNQRVWNDRSLRKPVATGSASARNRKGAKGLSGPRS